MPQEIIEQNRRELITFCQGCWNFTNFRHNKGTIKELKLMIGLRIGEFSTADKVPGRLKGPLMCLEIETYVLHCLKPGKSPGPDKCPNKLVKTRTDEEF